MNKKYLTFILYISVFSTAYGGFFYQEYISENNHSVNNRTIKNSLQNVRESTRENTLQSSIPSTMIAVKSASIEAPVKNIKEIKKDKKRPAPSSDISNNIDNTEIEDAQITNNSSNRGRSSINNPSETHVTPNYTNYLASASLTATANNHIPDISETTSPETSTDVVDTITNSNESSSSTDTSENITTTSGGDNKADSIAQPEEAVMATADCPYQLPGGTTEEQALLMKDAYGCRYRNSCHNKNDGTGTYQCQWEYFK